MNHIVIDIVNSTESYDLRLLLLSWYYSMHCWQQLKCCWSSSWMNSHYSLHLMFSSLAAFTWSHINLFSQMKLSSHTITTSLFSMSTVLIRILSNTGGNKKRQMNNRTSLYSLFYLNDESYSISLLLFRLGLFRRTRRASGPIERKIIFYVIKIGRKTWKIVHEDRSFISIAFNGMWKIVANWLKNDRVHFYSSHLSIFFFLFRVFVLLNNFLTKPVNNFQRKW